MDFNRSIDNTLREMLHSDPAFKASFESCLKGKILDALDNIDISKMINRGLEDMIRYMFIDDSYVYEDVRNMVCKTLEDNIRISFSGKDVPVYGDEETNS